MQVITKGNLATDNTHPNREWHKYIAYKMAMWTLKILDSYKK